MAIRSEEYLVTTARDLGAALKFFRTAAGVTQVDAAEAMGIGQPFGCRLMAAQRKYPDELRERAVKMVLEIRDARVRGGARSPGRRSAGCSP